MLGVGCWVLGVGCSVVSGWRSPEGIRRTTEAISRSMGPETVVAAIGQAGENRMPMSVVMSSVSHSAGGIGSVMGSKNLKAIAVRGTGSVWIAGDKEEWEKRFQEYQTHWPSP